MAWKISYFNGKVMEQVLAWPKGVLANYLHISELMQEFGPNLGLPHTKAMGDGLFEIRAKGQEGIGRAFFCTVVKNEVIILHSIIKKTQKTPDKDLKLARKRLKEFKR
ncbi:type II toxin-antitoxin system RelE/ParE family toxin [Piscirickettsia salmonis]|uniref:type II toxin-antitoxin system RelE/ParE family toxin n=1 Tax=Piscirickettsia salmonis TaxID=1238 RepID=UPI0012BADF35|nr:type II toxin-antitoxin system RelE/ParE family toxin [Piscirickettsia salmonis]QGP41353.1 Phage-related protein [Piscirickettsia salmonis]